MLATLLEDCTGLSDDAVRPTIRCIFWVMVFTRNRTLCGRRRIFGSRSLSNGARFIAVHAGFWLDLPRPTAPSTEYWFSREKSKGGGGVQAMTIDLTAYLVPNHTSDEMLSVRKMVQEQ